MGIFNIFHKQKSVQISNTKTGNNDRYKDLSKRSQEHLRTGEIGFYRNDLFDLARILEKEENLLDALKQYMYVFYLDTTGISNLSALRSGSKPRPMIAPGVVNRIRITRNKLNLSDEDFKNLYFECPTESILPNTIFSYAESYDLLSICLSKGVDFADNIVRKHLI